MNALVALTVGYVLLLALVVAICFLGDPNSPGILGKTTYFFTVYVPVNLELAVSKLPGGTALVKCWGSGYDYVCNQRNPLLQIVYLVLVIGGLLAFVIEATPSIPNRYMGEIHLYTSHLAVLATLFSFVIASNSNPGMLSSRTLAKYDHYEYDGFLYVKRDCPTCKIRKLPRSKHCSICGICVARFDHHCPWINTCVGEANYRLFLWFVFSTFCLLVYATIGISLVLLDFVEEKQLFKRQFINRETGQRVQPSFLVVATFLFIEKSTLIMLLLLCFVMAIVVFAFFGYHIYLIAVGTTTNESSKWGGIFSYYSKKAKRGKQAHSHSHSHGEGEDCQGGCHNELTPEEEKELLNPDTAPSLERRTDVQFPAVRPANIYNKGFMSNLREVLFPPSFRYKPSTTTTSTPVSSEQHHGKRSKKKRN